MFLTSAICFPASHAQVPERINHQGSMFQNGQPINASTTVVFKIYATELGGIPLYAETQTVNVVDGLYAADIGASNAVPGALTALLTNDMLYLELMAGGETLAARERISSVAYSLLADGVKAGGVTGAMLADDAVTSDKIGDGAVTTNALAGGAVTSAVLSDGSIQSHHLATGAVTTASIADGVISSNHLADGSVGMDQLAAKYQSGSLVYTNHLHFPGSAVELTISFPVPFSQTPNVTANLGSVYPEQFSELNGAVNISSRTRSNFTAQPVGLGAGEVIGPLTVDASDDVGWYASLAVVNGHPAISYYDRTPLDLRYVRASDPGGAVWGEPVVVDAGGIAGLHTSLAVINGRPAIAYQDSSAQEVNFVRAKDTDGILWEIPVVVGSHPGAYISMAVVNGRPAISYHRDDLDDLYYARATDADGTTWGTPVAIATSGLVGTHTSLAVVNGRPAISYADPSGVEVKFIRANDTDGTLWGAPATVVANVQSGGAYISLAVVNGRPAISFQDASAGDLNYVRANDADGTSWDTPILVDTNGNAGLYSSLAVIDGRPVISYHDNTAGELKFVRALDSEGSNWEVPITVDAVGDVGEFSSLIVIDDRPAIGYYADLPQGNLKYVRGASLEPQQATVIEVVDAGVDAGEYASLVSVNGRPAISYYDDTTNLKYVRAADEKGAAWGAPVAVEINGNSGLSSSLAIINGRPAIGYSELINIVNSDLKFVRAADANGTSWGSAVTVDDVSNVRSETSLASVNGRPAMAYTHFSPGFDLMYVRASDADGTTWDTPLAIDTTNQIGMEVSLAVVNGRPAICYRDDTEQAMKYVRASDTDGTSWGGPIAVTGTQGSHFTLGIVNGRPAISYRDFGASAVKYVRATDADGTGWNPAVTLDTNADGFQFSSLTVVGGLPTISYYDVTLSGLKYVQATDADGTAWGTPIAVEIEGDVGLYNSLLDLDGNPAISYHDETIGGLKFFTQFEKPITINWIAVEP